MSHRGRVPTVEYLAFRICKLTKSTKNLTNDPVAIQANYSQAENLFSSLMDKMQLTDNMGNPARLPDDQGKKEEISTYNGYYRPGANTTADHMAAFQRAICSLVRYAPTRDKALKYLCFFLYQIGPPMRTAKTEITMLINIIYIYDQEKSLNVARQAVDFIRIGLERGVFDIPEKTTANDSFQNPASVFRSVSIPILSRLGLTFSQDHRSIVQAASYSNRYSQPRFR